MDYNFVDFNSDIYSYEYFLQDDVCRLCWCKKAERDIKWTIIKTKGIIKSTLCDMIQDCLGLDLTQILIPKRSCMSCCDTIERFYRFKLECKDKDRRLQEILKQKNENLSTIEVKIEKVDEISDLGLTKTNLIEDVANFLDSLHSDKNSDVESSGHHSDSESLKRKHTKYKHKKTPTYCKNCRLDLESKEEFSKHKKEYHGVDVDNGLYKCFGCEKNFKSVKLRRCHEMEFCKGLKDGYKCGFCERFLPTRSIYDAHLRDHRENAPMQLPEDLFRCHKCAKFFKTKECLKKHTVEHKQKKFVCETCGRVFTRHDYLHKHKLTHTGTKQHICPHCGFRATQKSSLTVHIRKHTGERPYSCDICPQRCISSSNLQAHLRRHGGHKRYECKLCDKKFGYKVSLEEHVASTHERSQSYSCELCGAIYTRRRGLKRHLAAKHGKLVKENEIKAVDIDIVAEKDATEVKENEFVILSDNVM